MNKIYTLLLLLVLQVSLPSFLAYQLDANNCGVTMDVDWGCYDSECWAACDSSTWCYTTSGNPQSGIGIPCNDATNCNGCWRCAFPCQ
jgi:hypothetical protein